MQVNGNDLQGKIKSCKEKSRRAGKAASRDGQDVNPNRLESVAPSRVTKVHAVKSCAVLHTGGNVQCTVHDVWSEGTRFNVNTSCMIMTNTRRSLLMLKVQM